MQSDNQSKSAACKLIRIQTNLAISIKDVFGKEHEISAQAEENGKIRVLVLPCNDERISLSPDAMIELAKLVQNISVTVNQ